MFLSTTILPPQSHHPNTSLLCFSYVVSQLIFITPFVGFLHVLVVCTVLLPALVSACFLLDLHDSSNCCNVVRINSFDLGFSLLCFARHRSFHISHVMVYPIMRHFCLCSSLTFPHLLHLFQLCIPCFFLHIPPQSHASEPHVPCPCARQQCMANRLQVIAGHVRGICIRRFSNSELTGKAPWVAHQRKLFTLESGEHKWHN